MALNWCFNEPWPTIANNSIINYPADPKSSYAQVADACRNMLASARIPKFSWSGGENFSIELWLLNDSLFSIKPGTVEASIEINGKIYPVAKWDHPGSGINKNLKGPAVDLLLPDIEVIGFAEMILKLNAGNMSSVYRLIYRSKSQ